MIIREGRKEDLLQILELIRELAIYVKAGDQVKNTVEQMAEDGFGKTPIYSLLVAENNNREIIGMAVYYYRYSTWNGKQIYLEDLVVTEEHRGKGVGKLLFDQVVSNGKRQNCLGMMWQILNWNESALNFYRKYYHAHLDGEWINCSIEFS